MKGWLILKHSLRQVFGNLQGALKVSAVLYLAQFVVGLAVTGGAVLGMGSPQDMMAGGGPGAGFFGGILVAVIVSVVTGLWIAVGWHRYVLLGEEASYVPTFRGDRMGAYFLRSLGYGLILVIIGMIWGTVIGFVLASVTGGSMAATVVGLAVLVYLPIMVLGFRMASDLPSTALNADHPFMSGWAATAGATADLAVMAVIIVVAGLVIGGIGQFLFGHIAVLSLIWALVIGWVQIMVGVSILTTLYGHYIEKRELV